MLSTTDIESYFIRNKDKVFRISSGDYCIVAWKNCFLLDSYGNEQYFQKNISFLLRRGEFDYIVINTHLSLKKLLIKLLSNQD
jgi:hypothetical protein